VTLAADLAAASRPTGDATLVERETGAPGHASINVWDLYTDDGRYFFSQTEAGLSAQVKENNNQGGGQFGREVAAIYAVTGDLDTAALKMAWPPTRPRSPPGSRRRSRTYRPAGYRSTTTSGRTARTRSLRVPATPSCGPACCAWCPRCPASPSPMAPLTASPRSPSPPARRSWGAWGSTRPTPRLTGPAYQEAITINADTGIPLQIASGPAGKVTGTVTYVVTRVNLADIAAGPF
jgi:hypothetical protein